MDKKLRIFVSVIIILIAGLSSGYLTSTAINDWYVYLKKPFFSPPNWIFAPVWTILYIMMGISFGLIWNTIKIENIKSSALYIFSLQFVLNLIWSFLFFGLKNPMIALIDIILLWILIIICIKIFLPIHKIAAQLLYPYLLWVSFATLLNASILYLNPKGVQ